jgi:hypothetical protein
VGSQQHQDPQELSRNIHLQSLDLQEWGPEVWVLIGPPGDCDTGWCLRISDLFFIYEYSGFHC